MIDACSLDIPTPFTTDDTLLCGYEHAKLNSIYVASKNHFLRNFRVSLKHSLQTYSKIVKTCVQR